jgi:ferrous iron transport protein A
MICLSAAPRNSKVCVLRIAGRMRLIQRLAALGVVPGVMLTVLKPERPTIVSLSGARVAIGQSAADSIQVEVVEQ